MIHKRLDDECMAHLQKNLMIRASAGSGKTHQLSNRVISLLAKQNKLSQMVAITFTRKAAGEFLRVILTQLANAAAKPEKSELLRKELSLSDVEQIDFQDLLKQCVEALPGHHMTTLDAFFTQIARRFPYELKIRADFKILFGDEYEIFCKSIIRLMMEDSKWFSDDLIYSFLRAQHGQEDVKVQQRFEQFISNFYNFYNAESSQIWAYPASFKYTEQDWLDQKDEIVAQLKQHIEQWGKPLLTLQKKMLNLIEVLQAHTIGSNGLSKITSVLLENSLKLLGSEELNTIRFGRTEYTLSDDYLVIYKKFLRLLVDAECLAVEERIKGIYEVIKHYHTVLNLKLEEGNFTTFDEIKRKLANWERSEASRLLREQMDYRLEGQFQHWLLDEFQDTSEIEWLALKPWIDDAVMDAERSFFLVGDQKQSIYAWRGGDSGLFDVVNQSYGNVLEVQSMAQSWRSVPSVLDLVNQVFGSTETIYECFPAIEDQWQWETHVSAPKLQGQKGHAQVIQLSEDEDSESYVLDLLNQLQIGKRAISCGILVRSKTEVEEWANILRQHDYSVVDEAKRQPVNECTGVYLMWQLLKWLDNPLDQFALNVLSMSPLAEIWGWHLEGVKLFQNNHVKDKAREKWKQLVDEIHELGCAMMLRRIMQELDPSLSEFGKWRTNEVWMLLQSYVTQSSVSLDEIIDFIDQMQFVQNPAQAEIQVMTIHKSKGLGFDVVILPDIKKHTAINHRHMNFLTLGDYCFIKPSSMLLHAFPDLQVAVEKWDQDESYSALCVLYVAMTRAKRGLYCLIPPIKTSSSRSNYASLIFYSLPEVDAEDGVLYNRGDFTWVEDFPRLEVSK